MKRSLEDVIFGLSMSAQDYAVLALEAKAEGNDWRYMQCIKLYDLTSRLVMGILDDAPLGDRQ